MIPELRSFLFSLTLCVLAGMAVHGTDAPAPPATGHVLILDNDRTLEGDIQRFGDQYRVRREAGETWIAASRVLCLCASNQDACKFLSSRINPNDLGQRFRLAQWCHQHDLRVEAARELKAILAVRPDDVASQR